MVFCGHLFYLSFPKAGRLARKAELSIYVNVKVCFSTDSTRTATCTDFG
jgi:hypothetical protein